MAVPKINESEYRLCLILWENEPVSSRRLSEICQERLNWSKTTTYTVIRRLADRGVCQNVHSIVTSLVSKQEAQAGALTQLFEKRFESSLPSFLDAFAAMQGLTDDQKDRIRAIVEEG